MIAIRSIVCPVDFSEATDAAFRVAVAVASAYGAELVLLHVLEFPHETVALERYYLEIEDEARRRLGDLCREPLLAELAVRDDVLRGTPYDEVSRFAEREAADLIVMATHGRTGFDRFVVGSVTARVARTAPCPVLTVPRGPEVASPRDYDPDRIVLATDFSPAADAALPYAGSLSETLSANLSFVHVVTFGERGNFGDSWQFPTLPEGFEEQQLAAASTRLAERADTANGGNRMVETRLIRGTYPAVEIAEHAEEIGAGMIITARHGHSAIRRVLLGSTTEKLLRLSSVPLLIVPAD